ncbi:YodD family peroxide/acid resistance protein [Acerihabitans arboris]|uniref:YodD family peroxide/acid resistance protein n=1 Tax=Acerihabitans arboris TaxID=2691583 RepID=A0A845SHX4_9GAMM|nr:YodD family peroxide/acid resistance protein [Acerihabitans arboris]NDL62646.1 YodD family peroxide/acid resistance protein [Acerihabitans arboris]
MAFAKEYNQQLKREISIDVDALLIAVRGAADREVHEHQSNEHAHMVTVGGREFTTYGELAAAYQLDIRDYTVGEVNR